MGTCMYCGQSTGFVYRIHKEYEEMYNYRLKGPYDFMCKYLSDTLIANDLKINL